MEVDWTVWAWRAAVMAGREREVAQLLALDPKLANHVITNERAALLFAAEKGHDKVVAHLLAAKAQIDFVNENGETALHVAVSNNHEPIVRLLLAAEPSLANVASKFGRVALHYAASGDSEQDNLVAKLLAASPESVTATTLTGSTVLHLAASRGYVNSVKRLITADPSLVSTKNSDGELPLHRALPQVVDVLLAADPSTVFAVDKKLNSVLHHAVLQEWRRDLIVKLVRLHPQASHTTNCYGDSPFYYAVSRDLAEGVELLQWGLSFDDILSAFVRCGRGEGSCTRRYQPILTQQCESLFLQLGKDLVGIVFAYIGIEGSLWGNKEQSEIRDKGAKK